MINGACHDLEASDHEVADQGINDQEKNSQDSWEKQIEKVGPVEDLEK